VTDDRLTDDLLAEISRIPLIDPHTHIDPLAPTARGLDDLLGYHYYTELAHSTGTRRDLLAPGRDAGERVRLILRAMDRFDNTVQARWFGEIAREFLGFDGHRPTEADADRLADAAGRIASDRGWEDQVLRRTNVEKVFLTNNFDDPLEGFDTARYVPCLRADELVFRLNEPAVRERLARATGVGVTDAASLRRALGELFEHFGRRGARACAVSLPPDYAPAPAGDAELSAALARRETGREVSQAVLWTLAECCRDFGLPFALMVGVSRGLYEHGVPQGQDLFDQRTSLRPYAGLFNAFPTVSFCVSVLGSAQNQELAGYAWIFPNVIPFGHWWYANLPALIEPDLRLRLQAVPKVKLIGYYSDAYKLEFMLPKFAMYRRSLARVLADEWVRPGLATETRAIEVARLLLRDNTARIFRV
jgi:glucuronate isomerase